MDGELPSGWAPYIPLVTAFARTVLTAAGGVGFTWALTVNADQIQMAVSAAAVVVGAGWSLWQKISAMRALAKAAASPPHVAPTLPA